MKKIISIIIVLSVVCNLFFLSPVANTALAADTNQNKIKVNGAFLELDVPPVIIQGRMLVPVRAIFEALGATVQWDGATKTVTGMKDNVKVVLAVDSTDATVSGIHKTLDVPATIINGRVVVPLRFIAESLEAQVNWNAVTRTVEISTTVQFTLESIKFFGSGYETTPQSKRIYQERFKKSTTGYICWELNIQHPALKTEKHLELRHVFYSCDEDKIFAEDTNSTDFSIEPDSTSSTFAWGRGWAELGNWNPGVYRVDLYIDGKIIGMEYFEVYDDTAAPTPSPTPTPTPSPSPSPTPFPYKFQSLKFYESGYGNIPQEDRIYRVRFAKSTTRYINWELSIEYPEQKSRKNIKVRQVYYNLDENKIDIDDTEAIDFYVDQGWTSSTHTWGSGWAQSGNWTVGNYRADIYIDDVKIASEEFEVYDDMMFQ